MHLILLSALPTTRPCYQRLRLFPPFAFNFHSNFSSRLCNTFQSQFKIGLICIFVTNSLITKIWRLSGWNVSPFSGWPICQWHQVAQDGADWGGWDTFTCRSQVCCCPLKRIKWRFISRNASTKISTRFQVEEWMARPADGATWSGNAVRIWWPVYPPPPSPTHRPGSSKCSKIKCRNQKVERFTSNFVRTFYCKFEYLNENWQEKSARNSDKFPGGVPARSRHPDWRHIHRG